MPTISTERAESIDRENDQETSPGADRLTTLNTTLANNNNNSNNIPVTWITIQAYPSKCQQTRNLLS